MAEKKGTAATSAKKTVKEAPETAEQEYTHPKYVEVTIPRDRQYEGEAYFVCLNGKSYGIPRDGKPHLVPHAVAEIIKESRKQDSFAEDYMDNISISDVK